MTVPISVRGVEYYIGVYFQCLDPDTCTDELCTYRVYANGRLVATCDVTLESEDLTPKADKKTWRAQAGDVWAEDAIHW